MDRRFIEWPFFDADHRELAFRVKTWVEDHLPIGHGAEEDIALDPYCRKIAAKLGQAGLLDLVVPSTGNGFDLRSLCLARELLSRQSGLVESVFGVQGLGSAAISLFGNEAQQALFLPSLRRGETIAAFALSEPNAGSDAASLATRAIKVPGGWQIDGRKTWISNGGIADLYVVFARSGDLPGAKGISAFIVPANADGFSIVERIETMAPHPLATLAFKGCFIPDDHLIGRPGEGFTIAMGVLDLVRTSVGAAALGFARRAFDEALKRLEERQMFGRVLGDFQMAQAKIAEMAVLIDTAALAVYRAAWMYDVGKRPITVEAAMAKLHASEAAQIVIDHAVQLFGGLGVKRGTPVEALYREIRALRIYDGATDVQKLIIARHARRNAKDRAA